MKFNVFDKINYQYKYYILINQYKYLLFSQYTYCRKIIFNFVYKLSLSALKDNDRSCS